MKLDKNLLSNKKVVIIGDPILINIFQEKPIGFP